MKRFISTILVGFLLLSTITFLSGCGGGKPDDVSEQHYRYALNAISVADSYLDYYTSASEAYSQIDTLYNRKDELPKTQFGDKTHAKDFMIESDVVILWSALGRAEYNATSEIYDDILEYRNDLADIIGKDKR